MSKPGLSARVYYLVLLSIMLLALGLRLWGIKSGLPFVYNLDEGAHFVPKAVAFFSGDYNPHYFINPPAFSYLLHGVLAVYFGSRSAVQHAFAVDPGQVFLVARITSAVLGAICVFLVAATATRLFDRRAGLIAGAVITVAFLPVYYGHLALNDAAVLVPLTLSLYGSAGVLLYGRTRDWLLAGVGLGVAIATKYTAGIVLIPLLVAALYCYVEARLSLTRTLWALICTLAVADLAFFAANPYALLDTHSFRADLITQRDAAGDAGKLGETQTSGLKYYLWTMTWGFGWLASLAALLSALLLWKDSVKKALFLVPYPAIFFLYMGLQDRFFGRWLMPILPACAVLAAYILVKIIDWTKLRIPKVAMPVFVSAVLIALLIQPLLADIHNDRVLARADTRNIARDWMVRHIPPGSKIVLEPIVPHYIQDPGHPLSSTPSGDRWVRYQTATSSIGKDGRKLPENHVRNIKVEDYPLVLRPQLIHDYVARQYCWVVTGSTQYGRAFAQPEKVPNAMRYYRLLNREAKVVYVVSPFKADRRAPKFNFDWSFNYYPGNYLRPGPKIVIYRLKHGRCS